MLATQTMTGAAKKAKRDKKLSAESTAKPKSKTVEDPASKPSKLSKGKKRKEGESELVAELDQGVDEGIKKVKKAKKAHVDVEEATEKPGKDVVEVDDSIGEKKKRRKEKKEKAVVESPKQKSKTDKTITAEEEAVDIPQPKSKKSKKVVEVVEEALPEPSTKSTKSSKKSKKPFKEPSPDPSEDEVLNDAAEDAEEEDDGHLHGFSTDDDDSSDEEDGMDLTPEGVDLGRLPTIAKDDATVKRKLEKAKRQKVSPLYLYITIRRYSICHRLRTKASYTSVVSLMVSLRINCEAISRNSGMLLASGYRETKRSVALLPTSNAPSLTLRIVFKDWELKALCIPRI